MSKFFRIFAAPFSIWKSNAKIRIIIRLTNFFCEKYPNNTMELIERIEQIIKYKQLSVSGFEKKISASDGVIRRAIRNKTDIYSRFLVEITDNFPDISAEWLLREEGNIIRETEDILPRKSEKQPESDVILGLMNKIADLARENGQLQAEVDELKNKLARAEEKMVAYATTAAG